MKDQCRPNTWSCQTRPTSAIVRWRSQCVKKKNRFRMTQSSSSIKSLLVNDYVTSLHQRLFRQTTITISTVSTATELQQYLPTTILPHQQELSYYVHVFHSQSLLFLFGFLFFPCWWVGGYYLKLEQTQKCDAIEERVVHPSLLANGKTCCKTLPPLPCMTSVHEYYLESTFYKWNRIMSVISIILLVIFTFLLFWHLLKD